VLVHQTLHRRAGERRLPRQHLVEHAAEAVLVTAAVEPAAPARLLRAHVGRGADHHAGRGQLLPSRRRHRPGDPEVGDQRVAFLEQDVLGLDVAVHHALPVSVVQGVGHLARDLERVLQRKLPVPLEPLAQRLAPHVGHHEEQQAAGLAGVMKRQDVGVAELRNGLDLALEPLGPDGGRDLGVEHLDGHPPVVLEVLG
jgi:hypothetical protein